MVGGGGVPLRPRLEALDRLRHDGLLDRVGARVGDADHRGVPLLLQLVGGLGRGGRVDDDPAGVVVGRVDREGFLRRRDKVVGLNRDKIQFLHIIIGGLKDN